MSQKDLADALGVDTKTVNNWENGRSTPRNRTARLQEVLAPPADTPLDRYDDTELLAELLTRASRRQREERDAPTERATITPLPTRGGPTRDTEQRAAYSPDQPMAADREPPTDDGGA